MILVCVLKIIMISGSISVRREISNDKSILTILLLLFGSLLLIQHSLKFESQARVLRCSPIIRGMHLRARICLGFRCFRCSDHLPLLYVYLVPKHHARRSFLIFEVYLLLLSHVVGSCLLVEICLSLAMLVRGL